MVNRREISMTETYLIKISNFFLEHRCMPLVFSEMRGKIIFDPL